MRAGISVGRPLGRAQREREIGDDGTVPNGRIIKTDGGGHAIAELSGVLDVVDAGIGSVAAEQARIDVTRETVPGRRIGRGRLADSEAGELDEKVLPRDVTAGRGVKQLNASDLGSLTERGRIV